MTNHHTTTHHPDTGDRLVVVLRPVPDNIIRVLTSAGLTQIAADDTKVIYGPTGTPTQPQPQREAAPGRTDPPRALYTAVEAAGVLSVGRSTVYELLARGELESVRIGRCRRIPATSIDNYVGSLTSPSHPRGTIDPYRSSGPAQDAAVAAGNTDGRVAMARATGGRQR